MVEDSQAVRVEHAYLPPTRYAIKAARMPSSAPDWVLNGPMGIIYGCLIVGLAYSFWAKKDELVVAPLQLERETVTEESIAPGIVTDVLAREGDTVSSQDVLLKTQQTKATYLSDKESLQRDLADLEGQITQENDEYEHRQTQLRLARKQLQDSLSSVDRDRSLLASQIETSRSTIAFRQERLRGARQDLEQNTRLYQQKDISKGEYDRYKVAVDDLEKALFDDQENLKRLEASLQAVSKEQINAEISKRDAEREQNEDRHRQTLGRLNTRLSESRERLKAEAGLIQGVTAEGLATTYRSKFSGLVAQVHVKKGQIINPGTTLVSVVKKSASLVGRVLVQNKDRGRLKVNDLVMIKYFAYPYQEYGIPEGRVVAIASKPGGVPGKESMYVVQVSGLPETIAKPGGKPRALEMGVEGIAEIKVGEKRFIELLFSPISRFFTQTDS